VTVDSAAPHSRRALLAAAVGGALATLASTLGRPAAAKAANGDPVVIGQTNAATAETNIMVSSATSDGLAVAIASNGGTGTAIVAAASDANAFRASNTSHTPTIASSNIGALNAGAALFAVSGSSGTVPAPRAGVAIHAVQTDSIVGRMAILAEASGAESVGVQGSGGGTGVLGSSTAIGVHGFSSAGPGVFGESYDGTAISAKTGSATLAALSAQTTGGKSAVQGFAGPGALPAPAAETGVQGRCDGSVNSVGVTGESIGGTGVVGASANGYGVMGLGYYGLYGSGAAGVVGDVDAGTGVQGWTGLALAPAPVAHVGVWAGAENGRAALQVSGVARFSRSGRVSFLSGQRSKKIIVRGGITSTAFGLANLQANRTGVYVQAVVPTPSTSTITIYLNKAVTSRTIVAWFVVG
jgi:hypothetical protein